MLRRAFFGLVLVLATMLGAAAKQESTGDLKSAEPKRAALLEIKGAIGPATAQYLERAFETVRKSKADLVILQINTPGGLVTSMREIVASILASPVPVLGYVSPGGAHAASAGTYILYATHVAAMAPATNLGSATPVQMGTPGLPGAPQEKKEKPADSDGGKADKDKADKKDGKKSASEEDAPKKLAPDEPMKAKVVNDMVAYIRSLAQLRGRNADWAEKAVREAVSLPAKEAAEKNVVDFVARDLEELLQKANGRKVEVGKTEVTVDTTGIVIERIEPDWQMKFLAVITNPNVAFILMLIGIYGIIFEFWHPGFVGPGVIGAICLLLGLYAMNVLPLNYTGAGLVLLGLAFMTAEAFIPSVGILGIGGLIAFVFGATLLFDAESPHFQLSWAVIISSALTCGLLFAVVLGYAWRSFRAPVTTGTDSIVGHPAKIL
jgi:membrane-bound serine protease (ClpP class)